jgi:glycosyltransferase involved in cell wall biosynthesis
VKSLLFILPNDKVGGAERVALNLVSYLSVSHSEYFITVYFMARGDSNSAWKSIEGSENVILLYNNYKSEKAALLPLFFRLLSFEKFDFVYSTHAHINSFLSLARYLRLLSCKYLILRESTIISKRFTGPKKFLFNLLYMGYGKQNLLICQTVLMMEEFHKSRGDRACRNICVISNPINTKVISDSLKDSAVLDGNKQSFEICIIGRLTKIKNHELVIDGLASLNQELLGDIRLNIVGDGPMRQKLEQDVDKKNLTKYIKFIGNVENPFVYMKNSSLGVISSISEGFPNVLLEMMYSGTKNIVITPCTGGLDKISNIHVLNGFTALEMGEAIAKSISTPKDFSLEYKKYTEARDISYYWAEIQELLSIKN